VTLRAQLAEQSSTLLPLHPRIKELRAQIADLETQIRREAERTVRTLETDARIAGDRVEQLTTSLDQLKKQASVLGGQDVQLRALEREAKAQRDLLESYLARYRDATSRESPDAVPADARVISRAVPSLTPYFPRKLPIVLLTTLATLVFAVLFVAVIELMGGQVYRRVPEAARREPEEVPAPATRFAMPAEVDAPPAAWIGAPSESSDHPVEPPAAVRQRRIDALAEEVRALGPGVIVVGGLEASAQSSDVALQLARELAAGEARAVFVDLDVENALPRAAGGHFAPGLADLLFGVVSFTEVIQRDQVSRAHIIPLGRGVRDTAGLLTAQRLAIVLGALSQTYDHVVVAVGQLPNLAGAERLARFARAAVLVAAEDAAGAGAAASDDLGAAGFAHVMLVAVTPTTEPSGRAAA
jgi:Mrp family chromosome partitioning ATPase